MQPEMKRMSVYIHIPYCVRKCAYCDFLSFPDASSDSLAQTGKEYKKALLKELELTVCKYPDRIIDTVFFGGGTPSHMSAFDIADIMDSLRTLYPFSDDAEVSLEANPGTVDEQKLRVYKDAGINRLSFGLQSSHDKELKLLGRIHVFDDFVKSLELAEKAGFENINADLMSALPGQNVKEWEDVLRTVAAFKILKHISAYSLILEEGTSFYERYKDGGLPSEETDREMYHITREVLESYGYGRYEISNYAKPGYECRHNLVYWNRGDYIGVGLGASSCMDEVRFTNTSDIKKYIEITDLSGIRDSIEKLDERSIRFEKVMLGFRLIEGIDESELLSGADEKTEKFFREQIEKNISLGLLVKENGRYKLSDEGLDLADHVIMDFYTDRADMIL